MPDRTSQLAFELLFHSSRHACSRPREGISAVRDHLLAQLKETREHLNEMMLDAIRLAQQVVNVPAGTGRMEYVIAGETNLMSFAELSDRKSVV